MSLTRPQRMGILQCGSSAWRGGSTLVTNSATKWLLPIYLDLLSNATVWPIIVLGPLFQFDHDAVLQFVSGPNRQHGPIVMVYHKRPRRRVHKVRLAHFSFNTFLTSREVGLTRKITVAATQKSVSKHGRAETMNISDVACNGIRHQNFLMGHITIWLRCIVGLWSQQCNTWRYLPVK